MHAQDMKKLTGQGDERLVINPSCLRGGGLWNTGF